MAKIRLTKIFTFEMAHALNEYDGSCRQLHGHSYILEVTIIGEPSENHSDPKNGMVIDFKILKEIVERLVIKPFDHAFICQYKEGRDELFKAMEKEFEKIIIVDYQPTCENLITQLASKIAGELPKGVSLHHLKLHETATSYAEWYRSDNI